MGVDMPILFAGTKKLHQTDNLSSLFEAYDGPKAYVQVDPWRHHPDIRSGKYRVMVCDEFPTESPGTVVFVGHGFAGCKLYGLDQPYPYHSAKNSKLMNYVIAASEWAVDNMAKACGVPKSSVLPLGAPRTDAYFGKRKGDGGTVFAEKRTYLYQPTYRTKEETPLGDINWQWLDDQLTDDELFAVRAHPMTSGLVKGTYRHIREFTNQDVFAPYLFDCDVLITDYSATMIEAYLLGKPTVLFEKVKGYTETRGMYLDYPYQYCSRYATNEQELLRMIREADGLTQTERDVTKLLAGACDGHSVERICELIRSLA